MGKWFLLLMVGFSVLLVGCNSDPEVEAEEEIIIFDAAEYEKLESEWIKEKKGAIISVTRNNKLFDVQVSEFWYELPMHEKERIAEAIYTEIRAIAIRTDLIKTSSALDVIVVDANGNKLASRALFGKEWTIK